MRLVLIFLFALALRGGLAAVRYTDDFRNYDSGDYPLYDIGASHIRASHDFSNSLFLVRPPAYPLLVAALNNDRILVLAADVLAGALVAPVTYFLALQLGLSVTFSLVAALLVAFDPSGWAYSAFLGPEPVANLLVALALVLLLAAVNVAKQSRALLLGAGAGMALALSALSRPASYLLWIVLGLWLLARRKRRFVVTVFMLVNIVAVVGWTAHNGAVFGNATFSTIAPYTMLYYHAATVERAVTGKTPEETFIDINRRMEARLGRDTTNVDEGTRYGYTAATAEVQSALIAESLDIFRTHPLLTLATFPLGFVRMFGMTVTLPLWLRVVDIPFNLALLVGTVAGLWLAFRHRQWTLFWCVLLVCAYFTAGNLITKTTAIDTRERSMLTPFMAAACAYALAWLRTSRFKSAL